MADIKSSFEAAARDVQELTTRPDNDQLLELYALYKQATSGDITGTRPGMLDFLGRAKFDAWARKKGLAAEEAMREYVELVKTLKRAAAR